MGIDSTDQDDLLEEPMYTKRTAVLVKSYPGKNITNFNADYHVKPNHTPS